MIDASKDFWALGQLCQQLQVSLHVLERVALLHDIQPAMRLNGVPYFDGNAAGELQAALINEQDKDGAMRFQAPVKIQRRKRRRRINAAAAGNIVVTAGD